MRLYLFLSCFLFIYLPCRGQVITKRSECTGSRTEYLAVNDSVYQVRLYLKDHLLFDGFIFRPDTGLHEELYKSEPAGFEKHNNSYYGECRFYYTDGSLDAVVNYNTGEEWDYTNNILSSYRLYGKSRPVKEYLYKKGKLISEKHYNDSIYSITTITHLGSKTNTSICYCDSHFGNCIQSGKVYREYDDTGRLVREIFRKRGEHRPYKSIYYYADGSHSIDHYGNNKSHKVYSGSKLLLSEDYTYRYNRQGKLEYYRETRRDTSPYRTDITMRISRKHKTMQYVWKDYTQMYLEQRADYIHISFIAPGNVNSEYYIYENHSIHKSYYDHTVTVSLYQHDSTGVSRPECFGYLDDFFVPGNIRETNFAEILMSGKHLNAFHGNIQQYTHVADTFYREGRPYRINEHHKGNLRVYEFKDNKPVLLYAENMYHIAKDLNQCTEGLQDEQRNWVIPPVYSNLVLTKLSYQESSCYRASKQDSVAIYTWDGKLLLPPVRNLGDAAHLFMSQSKRDSLGIKDETVFVVNDIDSQSGYILGLSNTVIKSYKDFGELKHDDYNEINCIILTNRGGLKGCADFEGHYIPCRYRKLQLITPYTALVSPDITHYYLLDIRHDSLLAGPFTSTLYQGHRNRINLVDSDGYARCYDLAGNTYLTPYPGLKLHNIKYYNSQFAFTENGRQGLAGNDLEIIIPAVYDSIAVVSFSILAWQKDTVTVYNTSGVQLNNFACDEVQQPSYYGAAETYGMMPFRYNESYGCVNLSNGRIIAPAKYKDIGCYRCPSIDYTGEKPGIVLVGDTALFTELSNDSLIPIKLQNKTYLVYDSYVYESNHGIISSKNKAVITNVYRPEQDMSILATTEIRNRDGYVGHINCLGDWIVRSDNYKDVRQAAAGKFFVENTEGKSGVINCDGNYIIKPWHRYISWDGSNAYWYHSGSDTYNSWKLAGISDSAGLADTFYQPVTSDVYGNFIVQDLHKHTGAFDKNLRMKLPFDFDFYEEATPNYLFTHKSGAVWLTDSALNLIKILPYDRIEQLDDSLRLAHNNNKLYLLDRYYQVTDSSLLFPWNIRHKLPPAIESTGNDKVDVLESLCEIFCYYRNSSEYYEHDGLDVFPTSQIDHIDDSPQYDYEEMDEAYNPEETSKPRAYGAFYTPEPAILKDLPDCSNWYALSENTVTYPAHEGYTTYYLDTAAGIFLLPLDELIAADKKDAFNKLVRHYIDQGPTATVPCLPDGDWLKYFSTQFSIGNDFIELFDEENRVTITIQELKPLMHPYWQKRL